MLSVIDPGLGIFGQAALCVEDSGFFQTYDLASPQTMGLLKAKLVYKVTRTCPKFQMNVFGLCSPGPSGPALRINETTFDYTDIQSTFIQFASFPESQTIEFCLGEAYYGPQTRIELTHHHPTLNACLLDFMGLEAVDHLSFERVESNTFECPEIGEAINGDFSVGNESIIPGWDINITGEDAVADLEENKLHLFASKQCDQIFAKGKLSVPIKDNQALVFDYSYNREKYALFNLQGLDHPLKEQSEGVFKTCLPSWMQGSVVALSFNLGSAFDEPGFCSESYPQGPKNR